MRPMGLLIGLCWVWAALVGAYMAWGWYSHSGLFRILADWQIAQFGGYYPVVTAFLPWLLIGGPALSLMGRLTGARIGSTPPVPAAATEPARPMGRAGRAAVLGGIGLAFAAVGAGAYFLSLSLPKMDGEPVRIDIAALGDAPPPAQYVRLAGVPDSDHSVGSTESGDAGTRDTVYIPMLGKGEPTPATPRRFFLQMGAPRSADGKPIQFGVFGEPAGLLIRDGLPADVRQLYVRNGIALADPHYLLIQSRSHLETPNYAVAAIGLPLGVILLFFAAMQFVVWPRTPAMGAE